MKDKQTIGITYGTFDLFHYGHVNFLKRVSRMCDKLIVFVSTDEFNELKGKKAYYDYEHRVFMVDQCKFVDEVHNEYDWDQKYDDIKQYYNQGENNVILFMGEDWKGKFDDVWSDVVYLPRTPSISSTMLRGNIKND